MGAGKERESLSSLDIMTCVYHVSLGLPLPHLQREILENEDNTEGTATKKMRKEAES